MNRRLNDIIEFLPDPTFVIDSHGEVIAWNLAIEEMSGVSKQGWSARAIMTIQSRSMAKSGLILWTCSTTATGD